MFCFFALHKPDGSVVALDNPPVPHLTHVDTENTVENSDDYYEVEAKKKEEKKKHKHHAKADATKNKLNFSNSLSYVMNKKRPLTPAELIKSDPIISPLLAKIRNTKLKITDEIHLDTNVLANLFEDAMNATSHRFPHLLDDIEDLCVLFEKYFQSFLENNLDELLESHETHMQTSKKEIVNYTYLLQTKTLMNSAFSYNDKIKEYTKFIHTSLRNFFLQAIKKNFRKNNLMRFHQLN